MGRLLLRQVARTAALLAGVSLVVFSLDRFIPGDPAIVLAGENATAADIARTRTQLGLEQPLAERYLTWATRALQGDLGRSLFTGQPVATEIAARLPVTLSLLVLALLGALGLGLVAGVAAALHRNRAADRAIILAASLGVAMPNFWVGLLLVLAVAITVPLFPATGYVPLTANPLGWLVHLTLPALALSLAPAAELTRQVRGSVIAILQRDFVKAATAKGLPRRMVIGKHVLKNTGVTVATVAGIQVSVLLGGSVVMEQVFGLPGLGGLVLESVVARDLPIVQGIVLVSTVMILACNLAVELSYGYFNPKVRG
ncbi:MAG: ABC transporter permease [Betaproteobacteria bacterium]